MMKAYSKKHLELPSLNGIVPNRKRGLMSCLRIMLLSKEIARFKKSYIFSNNLDYFNFLHANLDLFKN